MKIKNIIIKKHGKLRIIGPDHPVFIIAEISCNHKQRYEEAVRLVKEAARAGADAVKFQTYTPDTMTIDSDKPWFIVGGKNNPDSWQKETFYSIYQKAYTPWEWLPKLKKITESLGMVFFSSVFDESSVDFMEKMNVSLYKIASYEATHIPLIKKVASTGKPVIISVGFASLPETKEAITALRKSGARDIAVLHCLTSYAALPDNTATNLATVQDIQNRFKVVSGLSDNNGGTDLPVMAVLAGASIIEKHLNLRHGNKSFDDRFSIDPKEFALMVRKIRNAEKIFGKAHYGPSNDSERYNRNFRQSVFAVADIKRGQKFNRKNIRVIRPGYGLAPKYYEGLIGKKANQNIQRGTPLSKKLLKIKK